MGFVETTVERVRALLAGRPDVVEKRIVGGGLGFMVDGHLCCGVSSRGITVRVGRDGMDEALTQSHVRRLELGGRTAVAFVVVQPEGYASDRGLRDWVERGLSALDDL